jgi:hypothetical protein
MPLISLSLKHGRTLEDARARLETTLADVNSRFGLMINRVDWSADRNSAKVIGKGFEIDLRIDATELHVTGDIPLIGKLLGQPILKGLKDSLEKSFQKRLT